MQTVVTPTKDVSIQCSLLPAPSLSFDRTPNVSKPEQEVDAFSDADEVNITCTEGDDSDNDYMTDFDDAFGE